MANLNAIEIFYPGIWNGDEYTNADMIDMVNNSNRCRAEFRALLSLNHEEVAPQVIEEAAFGVAVRYYLRRLKDGLLHVFADFENVPEELADLIHRFYPNRSIDLYPEFRLRDGSILKNVIAAVSFLGSKMPPAVKGMFPEFVLNYHHNPALLALQHGKTTYKEIIPMEHFQSSAELGAMLAQKRAELGITETDIAEAAGIGAATILDLEAGNVLPSDALIDALASAYQIDPALLRSAPEAESSDVPEDTLQADAYRAQIEQLKTQLQQLRDSASQTATPDLEPDIPDAYKRKMADLETQMNALAAERDQERRKREAGELTHFFERLETQEHVGKILSGPRVRELAAQLSATGKLVFSEGTPEQSPRAAFLDFLDTLAKTRQFSVPTDQIAEPGKENPTITKTAQVRKLIREYQKNNHCEYHVARLQIKADYPDLWTEANEE